LFYLFCLLLALTFSFWRQKEKGNKKKKPPSAVSDRLRSFARRKRRNSLRSNSLRFFSPCSASPLFGPKLRTGFFGGAVALRLWRNRCGEFLLLYSLIRFFVLGLPLGRNRFGASFFFWFLYSLFFLVK